MPDLAATVTCMAVDLVGVDAAIIFSDLLVPFESMGVTLLAGRLFENYDNEEIRGVAVVDHTLAQSLWPGESVVGRQMTIGLGTQLGNQDQGQNGDDSGDGNADSGSDQHQVQIVLGQQPEPPLNEIQPRCAGWCVVDMKTGVFPEPSLDLGMFVRCVVIDDEV